MADQGTAESPRGTPQAPRTSVPCSACGAPVDPLRAPRVAYVGERFRYFCSAACRSAGPGTTSVTPLPAPPSPPTASPEEAESRHRSALALRDAEGALTAEGLAREPPPWVPEGREPADVEALLLGLAVLGAAFALLLSLAGGGPTVVTAQLMVLVVATGSLVAEGAVGERDPTELHPALRLAGPVLAAAVAVVSRLTAAGAAGHLAAVALVTVASAALARAASTRSRQACARDRAELVRALDVPAHRVRGDEVELVENRELRPGEEVLISAGEVVPADGTVLAGTAAVLPWWGAGAAAPRGEGDSLVAGAKVLEGRVRMAVTWTGLDRAWLRCTADPRRRADVLSAGARRGLLLAERAAPLGALLCALAAFATGADPTSVAMAAAVTQAALASATVAEIGALHACRTLRDCLRRGIAWRSALAFDRAEHASMAVFVARGTLLVGTPEVTNLETDGRGAAEDILALAAGALAASTTPVGLAVVRAARSRGTRLDGARNATEHPGLGVTAVASSGAALIVGSRALMLRERVSIARCEPRLAELEALGRSVLLVALGGKLVGWLGLQDGTRPGARAAVQQVLDGGIEPVLLTGEARETSEAIARALDIEHVRPEILPVDRGTVVEQLRDGGAVVAVIGTSPADDAALAAADVSVGLGSAGSGTAEWDVQLASDDVRAAAHALSAATRNRRQATAGLAFAVTPPALAALGLVFSVTPLALVPPLSLLGALAALVHLRVSGERPGVA